jgi:hypothetical protein
MILRRITLEHYGCFGAGEFEFRRGLNLVCGNNESGKSLLLAVLPAVVLGTEHGARLRSWGDSLSCKAALLFADGDRSVRLTRELESNLVRLEEGSADGSWRECFSGRLPPHGSTADHDRYYEHLQRLFGISGEALLRALLDAGQGAVLLDGDGSLAGGLADAWAEDGASVPAPAAEKPAAAAARQAEIAALESELRADREEYQKGEEYLAWIRKRWADQGGRPAGAGKVPADRARLTLEQQRSKLAAELQKLGVPARLPADLPGLFAAAEELRQELAVLQQELTPLQRNRQGVAMPGSVWPLLATLVAVALPGGALLLRSPWLITLAGAGGALLLLAWILFLVRLKGARGVRADLDREIQGVESKRAAALARQAELAERFEALGLPSAPVEMVKLQQLCRRHQALIDDYRELCNQLGNETPAVAADDRHLRPEELPDAERRLALLRDSLQRRERRLRALQDGSTGLQAAAAVAVAPLTMKTLAPVIGHLLERLTCGRYREVRLVEGRLRLEAAPGQWVPPAACSRGTVDALLLALRLALAQVSGARLPLPVDDLPAALDAQRRQATLRTLERFAADHQVLLASYDEELAKRALRERWPVVNLNLSQASQAAASKEATDAGQLHLL